MVKGRPEDPGKPNRKFPTAPSSAETKGHGKGKGHAACLTVSAIIFQQDTWTVATVTWLGHRRELAGGESKRIPAVSTVPFPVLRVRLWFEIKIPKTRNFSFG